MKSLLILLTVFTFSCTPFEPTRVTSSFIKKAKDLGAKNQGIDKIVYQNENVYVIYFANGAKHGYMNRDESDRDLADILASEIQTCENICQPNDGVANLEIDRDCVDSTTVNMGSLCRQYQNKIKCICTNKTHQTITRSVVPSEKEIQTKTKELESVIWIAPQ